MKNKIFTLLFVMVASVEIMQAQIDDYETTCRGFCGPYLEFELSDGKNEHFPTAYCLIIRGLEDSPGTRMFDYTIEDPPFWKWAGCGVEVQSVWIEQQVENIGNFAFYDLQTLGGRVTFPESLKTIGKGAFMKTPNCHASFFSVNGNSYLLNIESIGDSAFYGSHYSLVQWILEHSSIDRIGVRTFSKCGLTNVNILSTVTYIGKYALAENSGMTSVTIPSEVAFIGDSAFHNCNLNYVNVNSDTLFKATYNYTHNFASIFGRQVKNYTIGNNVTHIGNYVFQNCTDLTSITIPNNVTSIGGHAFSGCSSLTSITWNAKNCESASFDDIKEQITSFTFGEDVENIPSGICSGMSNLTSVVIPDGVTSIGEYAFAGCTGLTSITIPNSVTSIGERAFYGCTGLTSVTIPNSVTSIGRRAFYGCTNLTSVTLNSNALVSKDYEYHYEYSIGLCNIFGSQVEEYIIGDDVNGIGAYAFDRCSSLTSVTIGNNVTKIVFNAFKECSSLTSVTLGNHVAYIGSYAFHYCSNLTNIEIPNSVTTIGVHAFSQCRNLKNITIPNSVTSIGEDAFYACTGLKSVTLNSDSLVSKKHVRASNFTSIFGRSVPEYIIGDSVTKIGDDAFFGCYNLKSVTISNNVTSIGETAFGDCWDLTNITIPNSVTNIGKDAFYNCGSLTSVAIPNSVTSIGEGAFYECRSLTSIEIPNSVTEIEENTFSYCSSLKSIEIPKGVTSIKSSAFQNCDNLKSVTINSDIVVGKTNYTSFENVASIFGEQVTEYVIGDDVTAIAGYAFADCTNMTNVTIGNNVKNIGHYAFSNCTGLTSVSIPESVTNMWTCSFEFCTGLTSITNYAKTPQSFMSNGKIFEGVDCSACTLYVPKNSVEAYKAHYVWKNFNILAIDTDDDEPETPDEPIGDPTIDFFTYGSTYVEARYMGNVNGNQSGDWNLMAALENEDGDVLYITAFDINSNEDSKIAGTYDITDALYNKGGEIYHITSGTLTVTHIGNTTVSYSGGTIELPLYEFKATDVVIGETTVSTTVQAGALAYDYQSLQSGNLQFIILADEKTQIPDEPEEPGTPVFFPKDNYYSEAMYMAHATGFNEGDWYLKIVDDNGTRTIAYFDVNTGSDDKIAGTQQVGTPYASVYYYDTDNTLKITGGTLEVTLIGDTVLTAYNATLPLYEFKMTNLLIGDYTVSRTIHAAVLAYDYQYYQNGYSNYLITLQDTKQVPTAVENADTDTGEPARKVLRGGSLYILMPDGRIYDMHGNEVKGEK